MKSRTAGSITSARLPHSGVTVIRLVLRNVWVLTCMHDAITSGKNPRGKRIIPNSDRATNALEAVRVWPVRTYTANVVTATWQWNNKNSNHVVQFGNSQKAICYGREDQTRGRTGGADFPPLSPFHLDFNPLLSDCHFFVFFDSRYQMTSKSLG